MFVFEWAWGHGDYHYVVTAKSAELAARAVIDHQTKDGRKPSTVDQLLDPNGPHRLIEMNPMEVWETAN